MNHMMVKKMKMSQVLMLLLLAALILTTPLLSTSLRHTYLYFIINLLIIALGAEAGLLSNPLHQTPITNPHNVEAHQNRPTNKATKVVEKSKSEKMVKMESIILKKCPSMPSIFFIAHEEDHVVDRIEEEEEEDVVGGDISGQELFTKAETFIGNFYKQLKMQREDSWKTIHGFYQKAL